MYNFTQFDKKIVISNKVKLLLKKLSLIFIFLFNFNFNEK